MARVYIEYKGGRWNEVPKSDFWIDKILYEKLLSIKMIQNKGWDGVIIVDGPERSGKSVLGMLFGWFLSNGKLTENNFAKGLKDAARKIAELPDRSVLIMDEASTLFSSKDSTSSAQKKLVKILDVVGQKNLIFILCLPCFFDLNKTIAVRRSKFLVHVYPDDNYNRGQFAYWGEKTKGKLYRIGKKNFDSYNYPRAEFVGEYFDFKPHFYEKYLSEVKRESLKEVLEAATGPDKTDYTMHNYRMEIAFKIKEKFDCSDLVIGKIMDVHQTTVNEWIRAYKIYQNRHKADEIGDITKEIKVSSP